MSRLIASSDITYALGYMPYDAKNPLGFLTFTSLDRYLPPLAAPASSPTFTGPFSFLGGGSVAGPTSFLSAVTLPGPAPYLSLGATGLIGAPTLAFYSSGGTLGPDAKMVVAAGSTATPLSGSVALSAGSFKMNGSPVLTAAAIGGGLSWDGTTMATVSSVGGGTLTGGLTLTGTGTRGPLYINRNPSGNPAGQSAGFQVWIGGNPTLTPGLNDTVAGTILVTNENGRGPIWGMDITNLQVAEGGPGQSRNLELEIHSGKAFNSDPFGPGTDGLGTRQVSVEFVAHGGSTYNPTAAFFTWCPEVTGIAWHWNGGVFSRIKDVGLWARQFPTDTTQAFQTAFIYDQSNSATVLKVAGTHTNLIDLSNSTAVTTFVRGSSTADTSLPIRNYADRNLALVLDSGAGAAFQSRLVFNDRGSPKWSIYKDSASALGVLNYATGNTVLKFLPDDSVAMTSGPINFRAPSIRIDSPLTTFTGKIQIAGTVQASGLIGDGVTDDAPALQAFINGSTGPLEVILPAGTIRLGSTITTPGSRSITVRGVKNATFLKWDAGVAIGWNHGQGTAGNGALAFQGVILLPTTNTVGIALRASFHPSTNPCAQMFGSRDVQIGGVEGTPQWHGGIQLYGAWNSTISDTYIFQNPDNVDAGNIALSYAPMEGVANPANVTTVLTCDNLFIQNSSIGIALVDDVQGINLVNCNISGPLYGVTWDATVGSGGGTVQITNSQMACSLRMVRVRGADNPMISNNLFIQFDQFSPSRASVFSAIELVNCTRPIITGNEVVNPGGNIKSSLACIIVNSNQPTAFAPGTINNNVLYTQSKAPVELIGTASGISVFDNDFWTDNPGNPASGLVLQTPAPTWAAATVYLAGAIVVSRGYTFWTAAGGTSGTAPGPSNTSPADGGITWVMVCPSLATLPNATYNRVYGASGLTTDQGGNIIVGSGSASTGVRLRGTGIVSDSGMDFGSLGNAGYVDLHDGVTTGNDADGRMIVTNGIQGTNFAGQITLQSGALAVISNSLGFYGHAAVAKPTVAGSRGGNAALQSLITALANFGLVVDSSSL